MDEKKPLSVLATSQVWGILKDVIQNKIEEATAIKEGGSWQDIAVDALANHKAKKIFKEIIDEVEKEKTTPIQTAPRNMR